LFLKERTTEAWMFAKIFIKEWRENIMIFVLAILMMIVLVSLNFSGQEEMTLYFSGTFLLLFLPFVALLIGSGGFYSEFKDNAWVYLFSRPIKKEFIWIFKYVSQLSILIVIFLIFFFIRRFLPGLDKIFQDLDSPDAYIRLFSLSLYIVMPLMAFTIAFSLSLLYDKQFIVFFVAILVGIGLLIVSQELINLLWSRGFYVRDYEIFALFYALSFILASILTFVKSDFSQVGKKILHFSKYVILFLILSFFLGTVWVTKGQIFSPSKDFSVWNSQKYRENLYLYDYRRGILRYDSGQDKVKNLSKGSRFSFEKFSLRSEKIAFFKEIRRRKAWYTDLWMMNADGSGKKTLIESHKKDSPFHNKRIESCILSSDGENVAIATTHLEKKDECRVWIHTLCCMNSNGTHLKSHRLDLPPLKRLELIAWPPLEDFVVLFVEEKPPATAAAHKIIRIDLRDGTYQVLVENVITPYKWRVSPNHDYLALRIRNCDEDKDVFAVLDLKTLEMNEIFSADLLKLWSVKWSPDGRKIAFSRAKELWTYYLEEDRLKKISQRNYEYEVGFDWTSDGQKFVLLAPIDGENHLIVMGENFQEEKKIKIPVQFRGAIFAWGLENRVLLKGTGKGSLWRVDLETEEWKKVY